jgi:alpha-amylase/alpha-mannosidase (GH57 family)
MSRIVIHGHFYQPPREDPWTGEIPRQPDAAPFHDWNERVYFEAYRPNAFCSIPMPRGTRIVNNFERMSFDVGPTLMSWLERHHPETHMRIVEADQKSIDRTGHGNAIAQAFHHSILPLATERDIRTEVRWGLADFRHRFGRDAEGMWLPETAASTEVLRVLIEEGVGFTVLAPWQAESWQEDDGRWRAVTGGTIDPRRPYRSSHPDHPDRSIAVFFYDGSIAQAIAFERAGSSAERFLDLFEGKFRRFDHVVHAATDGETYGHHHKFSDLGLAYALFVEADRRGLEITNYASYLERFPATSEVRLVPGGSSWSCMHGVERWRSDCGCHTGGRQNWSQEWRSPLRHAFDIVKRAADTTFEAQGGDLFGDPWQARDAYIDVIVGREDLPKFLSSLSTKRLDDGTIARARTLLDMQRLALAMYTSCGWFFNDVSGIETVQVMRYAARTMELLDELGGPSVGGDFLDALREASSNVPVQGDGAAIFASVT